MAEAVLSIQNGGVSLPRRVLFDQLSWHIKPGEVWAVLGVNGCGKSTFLRLLAGLPLGPTMQRAGEVLWQGCPVDQVARRQRPFQVAWMPQADSAGFSCSVYDRVLAGLYPIAPVCAWNNHCRLARVDCALERVGLEGFGPRALASLSGGEKRRVALAAAQIQNAQVTLLDEPLSQLDWAHQVQIGRQIQSWPGSSDKGVVWVTHEPNMAFRFSTHVLAFGPGRVWQGAVNDLPQLSLLERVYGCPIETTMGQTSVYFPKTD